MKVMIMKYFANVITVCIVMYIAHGSPSSTVPRQIGKFYSLSIVIIWVFIHVNFANDINKLLSSIYRRYWFDLGYARKQAACSILRSMVGKFQWQPNVDGSNSGWIEGRKKGKSQSKDQETSKRTSWEKAPKQGLFARLILPNKSTSILCASTWPKRVSWTKIQPFIQIQIFLWIKNRINHLLE